MYDNMYYNNMYYDDMYYDDMYPVRYSREMPRHPSHDYDRQPAPMPEPGQRPIFDDYCPPPYPMPCPTPMPMPMPMPEETLPAIEHLENLFKKLVGKTVNILIEGRQKTVECVKVIKVEDEVVVVELKNGSICVIPLSEISAVCMPKDLAKEYYDIKK